MKPIFLTIAFSLTTLLFSQSPILPLNTSYDDIPNNAYLKDLDNRFTPYVGTWVFQQGNTKVTIKFQKVMDYIALGAGPHYYTDRLRGNYKVEKNGIVVYNNLGEPIKDARITGSGYGTGNIHLLYIDYLKCSIWGDAEIWIDANGKLNWSMYMSNPTPYLLDECPEYYNEDFFDSMTLPYQMVLTKSGFSESEIP